jgi:hydrogenase-4 component F
MASLLVLLLIVPLAVGIGCWWLPIRLSSALTVATGVGSFGVCLALIAAVAHRNVTAIRYLRVDALSLVFLLATAFLYAVTAMYTIGYLRAEESADDFERYARRMYVGLNLFAWAMLCAPLVNGLALLWVAVEVTTVVSALLVAIDGTDNAAEAAWKYVLIASAGLGLALLGTIFMYYAGAQVIGQSYDLAFDPLLHAAPQLPQTPVRLAFILAVLGFGTKVGFFPVHTWLPDAHSEAPTPVSALLSGSLLAVSFYAVLRFYTVAEATLGPRFPQIVLLVFGVASLGLAALYLLDQNDVKRMLAYSSVEHMGILAIGVSFGAPIAMTGVLLHVLGHAAAKGNAFMGAGVFVRKFRTKELSGMRAGVAALPWSAPAFLLAILALTAMPPFGIFRSEFYIVSGGLSASHHTGAALLVILVTIAFLGLAWNATRMVYAPTSSGLSRGEPSAWMVVPPLVGLVALVVLGVHPPGHLMDLLSRGAAELGGRL